MVHYGTIETSWGFFGFVARGGKLLATFLPRPKRAVLSELHSRWPDAVESRDLLPRFRREVSDYFAGRRVTFSPPIDVTDFPAFRQQVLAACRMIPYGEIVSYADLARSVASPSAARAVGGAMAANRLPLVIPCHRVVRADGSIGGFSSPCGIDEKVRLLGLEGVEFSENGRPVPDRTVLRARTNPSLRRPNRGSRLVEVA